jgi:hypothetical protein
MELDIPQDSSQLKNAGKNACGRAAAWNGRTKQ